MAFNYKDLTYIRASLQAYEAQLINVNENDCEEDEFSAIQDDIQYIPRLLALTEYEIETMENKGPSLNPVRRAWTYYIQRAFFTTTRIRSILSLC